MKKLVLAAFLMSFFSSSNAAETAIDLKANTEFMSSLNAWLCNGKPDCDAKVESLKISKKTCGSVLEFNGNNLIFTETVPNSLRLLFGSKPLPFKAGINYGLCINYSSETKEWRIENNIFTHQNVFMSVSDPELNTSLKTYVANLNRQIMQLLNRQEINL